MLKPTLPTLTQVLTLLALATPALSVCGIHSFTSCADGIVHWFDPLTGEICDPLDCGGGRAPPRTVPGCPAYTGTETRATSASYLSCWTPSGATTTPSLATSTKVTSTGGVSSSSLGLGGSGSGSGAGTTAAPTGTAPSGTGTGVPVSTPNAGNVVGGPLAAVVAGAAFAVLV
ncbi:hypothetical protein B0T16DRAFT_407820 [Cercophora newfieldiana]|uniref:Uncharacterized protein n=1 Tax=Cercophora newfieldiana TaxID=92897 RepID=A0AA40CQZ3_9PEZI|nr:hypothetical protein B0T16DRAFT_407820 [Cercophora newfieldiana]